MVLIFSRQTTFHLYAQKMLENCYRASIQLEAKSRCKASFSAQVRFKLGMHACMCIFNIIREVTGKVREL